MINSRKIKNPWQQSGEHGLEFFNIPEHAKPLISVCGRGEVIKLHKQNYLYLVDNKAVTLRAGKSKELINNLCVYVLDKNHDGLEDNYWMNRAREAFEKVS